jgi:hypothetical protein
MREPPIFPTSWPQSKLIAIEDEMDLEPLNLGMIAGGWGPVQLAGDPADSGHAPALL